MINHTFWQLRISVLLLFLFPLGGISQEEEPIVRALLFYSPSCPHCHKVMTEDLPPLLDKYGDQIQILAINVYTEQGNELLFAAAEHYQIPAENLGVPLLIVGENVLIGGYDIPQIFPELIETGLAAGGIGWPDIPEFLDLLVAENMVGSNGNSEIAKDNDQAPNNKEGENISNPGISEENSGDTDRLQENDKTLTTDQIGETKLTTGTMTLSERFMQDKTGNMISAIVFLGMFISVMYTGKSAIRASHVLKQWPNWSIAILLVIGLTVAIYMSYVEFTHTEAVCGPVGNCNTVQQSTYANLFGIIPIGSLVVIGCLAIGFAWLFTIFGPLRWRNIGLLSLWGLSLIGTLFSIYLTFLEPFVIGATCSWCLTSAIVMTLLLWASTAPITQIGGIFHLDQYWRKQ